MPLWLANYVAAKMTGKETIPYSALYEQTMGEGNRSPILNRTPEEIELDFDAIIRRDRQNQSKEV